MARPLPEISDDEFLGKIREVAREAGEVLEFEGQTYKYKLTDGVFYVFSRSNSKIALINFKEELLKEGFGSVDWGAIYFDFFDIFPDKDIEASQVSPLVSTQEFNSPDQ